jgi:hypothetical protein
MRVGRSRICRGVCWGDECLTMVVCAVSIVIYSAALTTAWFEFEMTIASRARVLI